MFNLNDLDVTFQNPLTDFLAALETAGYKFVPYFGLRSPIDQAKLWRQSRTMDDVHREYGILLSKGAPFLAQCLLTAVPIPGPWKTNALPGLSWHQFGVACDCYWEVDGKPVWEGEGYQVYAKIAAERGLTTLGRINDWDHVQLPASNSPQDQHDLRWIDSVLRARFAR